MTRARYLSLAILLASTSALGPAAAPPKSGAAGEDAKLAPASARGRPG
ncbi:hypothetical protein LCGC14_1785080, partial [marine sediment metagenome]